MVLRLYGHPHARRWRVLALVLFADSRPWKMEIALRANSEIGSKTIRRKRKLLRQFSEPVIRKAQFQRIGRIAFRLCT